MPTLSAMFRLMDGYSSQVKKIVENTDRAAKVILGASKNTDGFNDSLMRTGAAANVADSGLSKLVKTAVSLAAVKKGMDLTDTYTNTNARLAMITGSLEEQRTLQKDIFAAADRSRGDYTEMARRYLWEQFGSSRVYGTAHEIPQGVKGRYGRAELSFPSVDTGYDVWKIARR